MIVGIGTSIPEFSINIVSALRGNGVGVGTVVGSNTFNILFVLGLTILVAPTSLAKRWVLIDVPLNILSVFVAALLFLFPVFGDLNFVGLTSEEAFALVVLFGAWLLFMLRRSQQGLNFGEEKEADRVTLLMSVVLIVGGLVGVFVGGEWVVAGAEAFGNLIGIRPAIIGLTIVGLGTSLPELFISVRAAMKGQTGIAVGNIIGSNIFDFIGIFGVAGLMSPIALPASINFDIVATLASTIILFGALFVGKKYYLGRGAGFLFVLIYLTYFASIIIRTVL